MHQFEQPNSGLVQVGCSFPLLLRFFFGLFSSSHDGRLIICGSEDHYSYMWKTYHEFSKFSSGLRRDRNDYYERFKGKKSTMQKNLVPYKKREILVGEAVVTVSCFAPVPGLFAGRGIEEVEGEVILTADFAGNIKVFSTLHSLS